ncbi:MAG: hypothetical protein ACJ8KO_14135 [Sulfurifustaceae bacterium]
MPSLSVRSQAAVGVALIGLIVLTRGYHVTTLAHVLPEASWAAFFLAGVYLRAVWAPALLFAVAALLDYTAVTWGGVSDFCISPAYAALLPAYAALWLAGRWYAGRHRFTAATLPSLALSGVLGTFACELISSGSFYFYSGRIANATAAGFAGELIRYTPASLQAMAFWIVAAALVHVLIVTVRNHTAIAAR